MTVTELINALYKMPMEAEVRISIFSGEYDYINNGPIYDSNAITEVNEMSSGRVNEMSSGRVNLYRAQEYEARK